MNCAEIIEELAHRVRPSAAARAHASSCPECAALLDVDAVLRSEERAPLAMCPELRALLAQRSRAHTPWAAWRRALGPATAVVASLALVVVFARRPDLSDPPVWLAVLVSLGFLGCFALGLVVVLGRDHAGRCASPRLRAAFLATATLTYVALTVAEVDHLSGPTQVRAFQAWIGEYLVPVLGTWTRHLPCTLLALGVGVVVVVAVVKAGARTVTVAPKLAGAVSGTAAAMATAFILFAFCSSQSASHVAWIHALPLAMIVAVGSRWGSRVLAV